MLSPRQFQLLEFIEYCPTCATICSLYLNCSIRNANKLLKILYESRSVKRIDDDKNINHPFVYYTDKRPTNIEHTLLLSRFLADLSKNNEIKVVYRGKQIYSKIIPDAIVIVNYKNNLYTYLVEVERTTNTLQKVEKYETYYSSKSYQEVFGTPPTLVFITNDTINSTILQNYLYTIPLYKDITLNRDIRKVRT